MAVRQTAEAIKRSAQDPLGIYLNDHLAGATAGAELARRMAAGGNLPADGEALQRLATEVAEDRAALVDIMRVLGVPVRNYKVAAAWAGEKVGRLKPNGRLRTRSPLSNLVELEAMAMGVQGKLQGWRTLRAQADSDPRLDAARLDELCARATRQADLLEGLRSRAAAYVIAAAGAARD
jgi:hypothetical protein